MLENICLEKSSPLTFSYNSESLATLNQSKKKKKKKKKIDVTLILSIIAKEKSDWVAKSEKPLVSYDFKCFFYNLSYFSDANRFFDDYHMCS